MIRPLSHSNSSSSLPLDIHLLLSLIIYCYWSVHFLIVYSSALWCTISNCDTVHHHKHNHASLFVPTWDLYTLSLDFSLFFIINILSSIYPFWLPLLFVLFSQSTVCGSLQQLNPYTSCMFYSRYFLKSKTFSAWTFPLFIICSVWDVILHED